MNKTKRNDVLIAMIKCPVCGNQISDKAKKCIHCVITITDITKRILRKYYCDHGYGAIHHYDEDHGYL